MSNTANQSPTPPIDLVGYKESSTPVETRYFGIANEEDLETSFEAIRELVGYEHVDQEIIKGTELILEQVKHLVHNIGLEGHLPDNLDCRLLNFYAHNFGPMIDLSPRIRFSEFFRNASRFRPTNCL